LVGLALAVAELWAAAHYGHGVTIVTVTAAIAALLTSFGATLLLWRGRLVAALITAVLLAVPSYSGLLQGIGPTLDQIWLSRSVAELVPRGTPFAAAGFHEPSLVFLTGTATKLVDGSGAADVLLHSHEGMALVEREQESAFLAALQSEGRQARALAQLDGFNYSRGRPAHLTLWELAPQ